ncbi:putative uncharacterized protein [Clostridium sp. CAG:448]|nr:putative uncharacterized protein [Clostridium sp. CAG:448]
MQNLVQMQQLLTLSFHQLGNGNSGPAGNDLCNLLLVDVITQERILTVSVRSCFFRLRQLFLEPRQDTVFQFRRLFQVVPALRLLDLRIGLLNLFTQVLYIADGILLVFPLCLHAAELFTQIRKLLLNLFQMRGGQLIGFFLERRLFNLKLHDFTGNLIQFRRHGVHFRLDQCARLIDQVDCLIRQKTVGNITVGKRCGSNQRIVMDFDAVINLVPLLQTTQDGNGVLYRRLRHHHRLETTLQGCILFDILPILIQRCRTDTVQFSARQHRFEQISCVHGTVRFSGAYDGVQFINEEDDFSFAGFDFVQNRFQSFFKFATVFGACHQRTHIQRENGFVAQILRYIPSDNPQSQSFRNRCLAHAGLTDQAGVVLGFPGKNTDHVPDLLISADHRIQLLLSCQFHKILTVLLEYVIGVLRMIARYIAVPANLSERAEHLFFGNIVSAKQAPHRAGGFLH